MFGSEKEFLKWLLLCVKQSKNTGDLYGKICTEITDTDTRTTEVGTYIAVAAIVNGRSYVYSLWFEDINKIKTDKRLIKSLELDINQYD